MPTDSLALRRDVKTQEPAVQALVDALGGAEIVVTTGLVLQELLQGFSSPKSADAIIERFSALALIHPTRNDHVAAATIRNRCRRGGVQLCMVDALIAQICISNQLTLLTTDQDFRHAAKHCELTVWPARVSRSPGQSTRSKTRNE